MRVRLTAMFAVAAVVLGPSMPVDARTVQPQPAATSGASIPEAGAVRTSVRDTSSDAVRRAAARGRTQAFTADANGPGSISVVRGGAPVSVEPACDAAAPGYFRCLALRVVTNEPGTGEIGPAVVPAGYGPADLQSAYNLTPADGAAPLVAIVDAYDLPWAEDDLAVYRAQFGLPACTTANGCFRKVDQRGGTAYPTYDPGWGGEIDLDVQMVSAICPSCHILLVEADSAYSSDLGAAVDTAARLGAVAISNSYGGPEDSGFSSIESHWNHPGIAVTVSSGDWGYGVETPASSPHVVAVGGTRLVRAANGRGWTETAWSGAGSGCSAYQTKPAWQTDSGCTKRTVADVSAVADPSTGVAVYDPDYDGWNVWGGTSVSSPIIASIFALASGAGFPDYPAKAAYANAGSFNDVTSGSNGTCTVTYWCTAGLGYDGPTGLGTPNGFGVFRLPYTIGGTVRNAGGYGVAGILVTATSNSATISSVTGPDGRYLLGVGAGSYTIALSDPTFHYRNGYYGVGGYTADQASALPVTIVSAPVTGIDVQLPLNARITGTVRRPKSADDPGGPIAGVVVTATAGSTSSTGTTNANGVYSVFVPAGSYKVFFSDPLGRYASGYYGGHGTLVSNPVDAATLVVGATDVTGVDIELPDAPKRTFFSMQSQPGDWVGGGQTYNYSAASSSFSASHAGAHVGFYIWTTGHWWYADFAAPSGQPLVAGVYSNATRYPFQSPNAPGLSISGDGRGCNTLTGSFTVLDAVYGSSGEVLVFDATFVQHCEGGTPALTGEISYIMPSYLALSPATATIQPGASQPYHAEGYNAAGGDLGEVTGSVSFKIDGTACSGATCTSSTLGDHTVTGTWGSATGNATLTVFAPQISGTVRHGLAPLSDIEVILYGADGWEYADALTAADGTWSIVVEPGEYTVFFLDPAETYGSGFLGESGFTYEYLKAQVVTITDSNVTGKDVDLPLALHIQGTITDDEGHGLAGIDVSAANDDWGTIPSTVTDADGHYSMAVIPGSYRICAFDQSGTYPSGFWSEIGFTEDYEKAGLVEVTDADRTGIDIQLPAPVHISGVVTDAGGTPIEGIDVDIYTPTDEIVLATFTDANGAWSLTLGPGDHIVAFVDWSGTYSDGYWSGTGFTANRAEAAPISSTRSDVNVKLPLGLSAPRNVVAAAGDGSATVWWQAPASDGGAQITQYLVTSTVGGKTCTATVTLSCTISGLTNGVAYQFVVTAWNAAGQSRTSDLSNTVTPAGVPGKPTSVVATAGAGFAIVEWTAPNANGATIGNYKVTSSPAGGSCSVSTDTKCTVFDLTAGQTYTFTVVATNAVGDSAPSDPSNPAIVYGVPGKPVNVVATAAAGSAHVSWDAAPANGAEIISYTVSASPGGASCTAYGDVYCDVTGLTNGTAYTFTVTAMNRAGTGPASDPSAPVTPVAVPTKPTQVSAARGNASAVVTWQAPASDGGFPITLYTVTSSSGGFGCTTTGALSCTVNGLANGTAYTFTVTATNAMGTGPASDPSAPVTPAAVPGQPTGVVATAGAGQATVSWSAPASNGAAITSYTVTSSPGGRTCTTATTSCSVTGLTNGQPYTFTVHATNEVGSGPESAPSAAVTPVAPPAAPTGVRAVATNGAATISWYAPAANGSPITGYTVTASPGGRSCTTTTLSCSITGLTNGTWYTFAVRATNGAGAGSPGTSAAVLPLGSIVRAGGPDVFATAVAVSSDTFPASCGCVAYVASSSAWADALAAAAAAGTNKGPVLFVASSGPINAATAGELTRLKPSKIVVVGGTASVTPDVYDALSGYAPAITRYGGANRFEVAANISAGTFAADCKCVAYVANGYAYADALAGAAAAGRKPGPVLLVNASGGVPAVTAAELKRLKPTRIVVLGGTGSVTGTVYTALSKLATSITRYGGADRYATAALISYNTFPASCGCVVYVAAAYDPYSAIAGASAAGKLSGPLLLVASTGALRSSTVNELKRLKPYRIVVLGNTAQVSAQVFSLLTPYAH